MAGMISWIRQKITDLSRSPRWPTVRKRHLERNPSCAACGATTGLEVHHIVPFHAKPELELDPLNLITLCGPPRGCHLWLGHACDFKAWRPDVRRLAGEIRAATVARGDGEGE